MVTKSDLDYKSNYFEYPELTPIHGKLMTSALLNELNLQSEVRSNAQSVGTTLKKGGTNGHLGLVFNTSTYASIPGTTTYV
eukprot:15366140-Ditylum_brightwellii.AAC.1